MWPINVLAEKNRPLKTGLICSSETSVSKHLKPPNNPEDGKIQFKSSGRPRSCKESCNYVSTDVYYLQAFLTVLRAKGFRTVLKNHRTRDIYAMGLRARCKNNKKPQFSPVTCLVIVSPQHPLGAFLEVVSQFTYQRLYAY